MARPCARPWRGDAARSGARVSSSCPSSAPVVARSPRARPRLALARFGRMARLGHGGRSSTVAPGAGPWRPVQPPRPRSAPVRAFFTRRAALARDPRPDSPFFPVATPAPASCASPPGCWCAAMASPWLRRGAQPRPGCWRAAVAPRGFGAVRSLARLGGLLARLARVACPRQRPARSARVARPRRRGVARPLASQLACGSPRGLLVAAYATRGSPSATCSQQQLARIHSSGPRPRSLARVACSSVHAARPRRGCP
jgi:hypothetical protein